MKRYQTDSYSLSKPQASVQASKLNRILAIQTESTQDQDELTRFLQGGKFIYLSLIFCDLISLILLRFSLN